MYITASTNSMNDMTNDEFNQTNDSKLQKKLISMCFGCGNQINDQYILRVAPDLEWHAKCLKCFECGQYLDENCTCFVRNGKTYCKLDYVRLFSKKCFKCKEGFNKNDFVMRANNRIYHIDCFRCCMCNKQLAPGDEFALKEDGLLCKIDNELYEKHLASSSNTVNNIGGTSNNGNSNNNNNNNNTNNSNSNPGVVMPQMVGASSTTTMSNSSSTPSLSSTASSSSTPNNSSTNNPSSILTSTSCQNITNLQQSSSMSNLNQNNINNNNPNKCLIKCEDLNGPNDYEDNQNCLSPSLSVQQQTNSIQQLTNLNHSHHSHLGPHGPRLGHLTHPQHHLNQNGHLHPNPNANLNLTNNQRLLNGTNGSTNLNGQNGSLNTANSNSNSSTSSNSSNISSNGNGSGASTNGSHHGHHRKDKTTRVRTVLNEKQLHTLRTCYGANPRPDAGMKEQLVEMTGLSPRVIRVWFQNKRCKDKKKTILIKKMQEEQKNRQSIGHGISMIASSPVRNDINNLGPPSQVEIQQTANAYQSSALSWKPMGEFNINGLNGSNEIGNPMNSGIGPISPSGRQLHSSAYDQMMNFASDEEDCFDQLSDQGGDDSVSSVGLEDSRIQQL